MPVVPTWRLYALRALYLLIFVGLGLQIWPAVLHHRPGWPLMDSVAACMLAAFGALCGLGLRYPLQMLPLLLWELCWKVLWLSLVALPLWRAGQLDANTAQTVFECSFVILIPLVLPWRYVVAHYVTMRGDSWGRTVSAAES